MTKGRVAKLYIGEVVMDWIMKSTVNCTKHFRFFLNGNGTLLKGFEQ